VYIQQIIEKPIEVVKFVEKPTEKPVFIEPVIA